MLQWMGGGRRKVKTTKKSLQARYEVLVFCHQFLKEHNKPSSGLLGLQFCLKSRQHQFFEQRRQQLRSQGAPDLVPDKFSQPPENIYSLDIASLKNLSKLAQQNGKNQSDCAKSPPLGTIKRGDESKNSLCLEECESKCEDSIPPCTGSQPAISVNATAHLKETVGTQWTPASAAAAASLGNPEPLAFQRKCTLPAKNAHVENRNEEEKTSRIQVIQTQEKDRSMKHLQKKTSRQHRFEEFQILDLINDSHETAQRKNHGRCEEEYAAYVLEGLGKVPNCTPKIGKAGHNKGRHKEAISACNSKRGSQQLPQVLNKGKYLRGRDRVQLQPLSMSARADDHEAVTDLESFSDSNGEQSPGECKMSRCGSFREQNLGDMSIWNRLQKSKHLSSWACYNDKSFLGSDFNTGPDPLLYNGANYQKLSESPKSFGFSLDEYMFSTFHDYGSANINCKLQDFTLYDEFLSDDNLRDDYSSLSSDDRAGNFEIGGSDDKLFMDGFSSPPPQPLFEKDPLDFSFKNPATEVFSDSTFEFQVTILERNLLDNDFQSPSLWERKLDATQENGYDKSNYLSYSTSESEEIDSFDFLNFSKQDDAEISARRNQAGVETESSSLDTVFGTGTLDFASPTSPLFNASPHVKLTDSRILT